MPDLGRVVNTLKWVDLAGAPVDHDYSSVLPRPNLWERLSAAGVERIVRAVEPCEYEKVYGAFWDRVIERDGKAAVARSAERYRRAINGQ